MYDDIIEMQRNRERNYRWAMFMQNKAIVNKVFLRFLFTKRAVEKKEREIRASNYVAKAYKKYIAKHCYAIERQYARYHLPVLVLLSKEHYENRAAQCLEWFLNETSLYSDFSKRLRIYQFGVTMA